VIIDDKLEGRERVVAKAGALCNFSRFCTSIPAACDTSRNAEWVYGMTKLSALMLALFCVTVVSASDAPRARLLPGSGRVVHLRRLLQLSPADALLQQLDRTQPVGERS